MNVTLFTEMLSLTKGITKTHKGDDSQPLQY